jgi:hypothetical protein
MRTTVRLDAGRKSTGDPVFEKVLVDPIDGGQHRVVASPTLVLGVAAGDTIAVGDAGRFDVTSRGGNQAVQVYGDHSLVVEVVPAVWTLGGALDGRAPAATVFTIPVTAGFENVERVFNELVARHPAVEWYYGNVYDPQDGVTPLLWWE